MGALCCVANVAVTTKTEEDNVASFYKLDSEGNIIETKPSHLPQGIIMYLCILMLIINLFIVEYINNNKKIHSDFFIYMKHHLKLTHV